MCPFDAVIFSFINLLHPYTFLFAINFRDKVAQRLATFFFRDTKHTLHPSFFKHLKLRDLFEKLLEWKMILDFISSDYFYVFLV